MRRILSIALLVIIHLHLAAQTTAEKADSLMSAYAQQYKFTGSVLVAQKGQVLLEKAYGFRNAYDNAYNSKNTIYQIGSVTKQFTATVILKLQEEKKLDVKDKLSKYFPDYPKADSITIENLLTHTSGVYNYTADARFMNTGAILPITQEKLLALFKDKPLDFSPGTRWSYSNSGYILLGYIIEKVTGQPYEKVVRKYIFQPLGMTHSGFDFIHLVDSNRASGYLVYTEKVKTAAKTVDSSVSYAAGAIYATVGDLYKWHKGLLTNKIISQASLQKAYTPFKNKYGYGWGIDSLYGNRIIAHSGGIFGFNSNIARVIEDEVCIVLLSNANTPLLSEINNKLLAILYNKPYEIPKVKKEIAVAETVLQQYVGDYEMAPGVIVKFFIDNGVFKTQLTGQPAFELYAEAEDKFFLKVVEASIRFFKNTDGKYDKCILYQNGAERVCKRIK